jgi:sugar/nucleoside kinase (ribokinase family)
VALAQNNINTAFIGKVGNDEVGDSFIKGLENEKVVFENSAQSDESETGRCLVMVTPDAQRTMSTYLGISQKLNASDVNDDVIANSKITYLEGYLWDLDDAQEAIKKAIKISKNAGKLVAFSVSDVFCIERFRDSFLSLVNNEADIIFANEEEIKSLYEKNHLDECLEILNKKDKIFAITLGEKGAMIVNQDRRILIKPEKIERLVDTTGAGDLFAAGFLLSFLKNESMENCGATGVSFASKVIQIYGARL